MDSRSLTSSGCYNSTLWTTTRPRTPETAFDSPRSRSCARQLADKQDRLLRALAETDNVRRRAQRDREDYVRFADESLLRDLIPVLDNFDRALDAARAAGERRRVVDGIELIQRELLKVLERTASRATPRSASRSIPRVTRPSPAS